MMNKLWTTTYYSSWSDLLCLNPSFQYTILPWFTINSSSRNLIIKLSTFKNFHCWVSQKHLTQTWVLSISKTGLHSTQCTLVHALICHIFSMEKHLETFWKCIWKILYIHEYACQKIWGILSLLLKRLQGIWSCEVGIRILPLLGLVIEVCICLGSCLLLYHVESPQVGDVPIGLDLAAAYA
jgi:hypothetical protein